MKEKEINIGRLLCTWGLSDTLRGDPKKRMEVQAASSFVWNLGSELLGGLRPALSARHTYGALLGTGHMPVIYKV